MLDEYASQYLDRLPDGDGYFWDGNLCSNPELRFKPDNPLEPPMVVFIGNGPGGHIYKRLSPEERKQWTL